VGETPRARRPAPRLGEHTREVLAEAGLALEDTQ
jgi:crotonobetainyl-CoA:carnitine CoA-transferase CaiB-like acyl-CoA transferase